MCVPAVRAREYVLQSEFYAMGQRLARLDKKKTCGGSLIPVRSAADMQAGSGLISPKEDGFWAVHESTPWEFLTELLFHMHAYVSERFATNFGSERRAVAAIFSIFRAFADGMWCSRRRKSARNKYTQVQLAATPYPDGYK